MAVTGPWPLPHHLRALLHREWQSEGHPAFTSIDPSHCPSHCPPYNITPQVLIHTGSGSASQLLYGMTSATSSVLGAGGQPATRDHRRFCAGYGAITGLVSHHGANEEPSQISSMLDTSLHPSFPTAAQRTGEGQLIKYVAYQSCNTWQSLLPQEEMREAVARMLEAGPAAQRLAVRCSRAVVTEVQR